MPRHAQDLAATAEGRVLGPVQDRSHHHQLTCTHHSLIGRRFRWRERVCARALCLSLTNSQVTTADVRQLDINLHYLDCVLHTYELQTVLHIMYMRVLHISSHTHSSPCNWSPVQVARGHGRARSPRTPQRQKTIVRQTSIHALLTVCCICAAHCASHHVHACVTYQLRRTHHPPLIGLWFRWREAVCARARALRKLETPERQTISLGRRSSHTLLTVCVLHMCCKSEISHTHHPLITH